MAFFYLLSSRLLSSPPHPSLSVFPTFAARATTMGVCWVRGVHPVLIEPTRTDGVWRILVLLCGLGGNRLPAKQTNMHALGLKSRAGARAARILDRSDDRAQPHHHHDGDLLGESVADTESKQALTGNTHA